jgi:hypothetical protein
MLVLIGFVMLFGGGLVDLLLGATRDENNSMDMGSGPGVFIQILGVILIFVGLIWD